MISTGSARRRSSVSWLGSVLVLFVAHARCVADSGEKLDDALRASDGFQPVFVRMEDQLFKRAGDYEAFCRENDAMRRSVVREKVTQTLRRKAEQSWDRIKDRVAALEAKGQVRDVTRFWIVGGFACDATAVACNELASDPNVAFIYLQRGPASVRQHRRAYPASSPALAGGDLKAVDDLPPALKAQVMERLKAQGIDPAQVKVKVGAGAPASPTGPKAMQARLQALAQSVGDASDTPFSIKGLEIPWNLKHIQADQVWEQEGVLGNGVVVAINDMGFADIPALVPALWKNAAEELNGKDDDGNGYVDDLFGYDFAAQSGLILNDSMPHGTMCAGIVAGRPLPDQPLVTGVAPRARLMALNGMGYLKAYEYALANGADVLSMSYMWVNMDLGQYRGVFRTAAEHLSAGGVLPLGGAGNFAKSAPEGKQICNPKDIPCVVAVAGVLEDGKRPEFSSLGPCSWTGVRFYDDYPADQPHRKPDLTAPAGDFPCWMRATPAASGPQWKSLWKGKSSDSLVTGPKGNSFAGPHVAGTAALVLSANPELNAWQVKRILEETSKDLGEPGPDYQHGAGLVQALDAVRAARKAKKVD